jgi:hypothetical protein
MTVIKSLALLFLHFAAFVIVFATIAAAWVAS